ncbi:actin domain-containing protein [Ditylenchus destructor]|nr:actin domain-containing protein [Ditylenchus destructor]
MDESKYSNRKASDYAKDRFSKRTFSTLSTGSTSTSVASKIDSRPAVVIEIGNRLTRIGFAGEFTPREIFQTQYIDPLNPGIVQAIFDESYSDEKQYLILVQFLRDIVFRKLLTTINRRRVIIIESLFTPTKIRHAIAKALFECPSLAPYSVLFAPSHLLCTFPFNAKTCLVVDISTKESVLFPIAEGVLMLNNFEFSPISTSTVEENLERLLLNHAKIRTIRNAAIREFSQSDLVLLKKYNMVEDIVFRFCFATTMERGRRIQAHEEPENPSPDVEIPFDAETLIIPGFIREAASEVLFTDSSLDNRSIVQMILDAIVKVPCDLRRVFVQNLLITGGIARMPGLLHRVKEEMLRVMWEDNNYFKKFFGEKTKNNTDQERIARFEDLPVPRFYRFDKDIGAEFYCAWLGGSMFGTLDIVEDRSLIREDWLSAEIKAVPDWTNKIDDYFKNFEPKSR